MFENPTNLLLWILSTWVIGNIVIGFLEFYHGETSAMEDKLKKHLDDIIHRVEVVKQGEVYYWFDHDDNEFLGQGATDSEVIEHIKKRFPTHIFYLPTNHLICAKTEWQPKSVGIKELALKISE